MTGSQARSAQRSAQIRAQIRAQSPAQWAQPRFYRLPKIISSKHVEHHKRIMTTAVTTMHFRLKTVMSRGDKTSSEKSYDKQNITLVVILNDIIIWNYRECNILSKPDVVIIVTYDWTTWHGF